MEKNIKILVVDGARLSRSMICTTLAAQHNAEHLHIAAVGSAGEALHRLANEKFDIITSALQLPDMYGIDLCRTIRTQPIYRFTPFIVVTAEPHERHMKDGFRAGVTDYYDKTHGMDEFVPFMRGLVERYTALSGKVLYVEDNDLEAALMVEMMERHGLLVVRASSAEQALRLVDDSFDLVVTGFQLREEMSGGDFLHTLRCGQRYSHEELPVLVITGSGNADIQAEIFHAGGNDFVIKPVVEEVFISRLRSLMLVKKQFYLLRRQSEEMRRMASQDILTGVYNKRYLVERATQFLADPHNHPAWVVVLDLDHFKIINDRHGHMTGDHVLQAVGVLFRGFFREGDVIARSGGEEFVMLLKGRSREECLEEMEELRLRVEALRPEGLDLTASIGVASNMLRVHAGYEEILDEADRAMYRAKDLGRNRVVMAGATTRRTRQVGQNEGTSEP
jgi:two-component system, cell cycle response regulator